MAELKTKKTGQSVAAFLNAIDDSERRADCKTVAKMMAAASGCKPAMWGTAIVGYGRYDYQYASGREGSWFVCGFSPRKQALTLYIMPGFEKFDALMKKLGEYKTGKSCLYVKSLADVDLDVLQTLITESVRFMQQKYPN